MYDTQSILTTSESDKTNDNITTITNNKFIYLPKNWKTKNKTHNNKKINRNCVILTKEEVEMKKQQNLNSKNILNQKFIIDKDDKLKIKEFRKSIELESVKDGDSYYHDSGTIERPTIKNNNITILNSPNKYIYQNNRDMNYNCIESEEKYHKNTNT